METYKKVFIIIIVGFALWCVLVPMIDLRRLGQYRDNECMIKTAENYCKDKHHYTFDKYVCFNNWKLLYFMGELSNCGFVCKELTPVTDPHIRNYPVIRMHSFSFTDEELKGCGFNE